MTAPYPPLPVPGPANPTHTPTPAQYGVGAVRRNTATGAAAVRASYPTTDGTLDWLVVTTNYGGYFASWDDVGVSGWVDVPTAFLIGAGTLSAVVLPVRPAGFGGAGTLSAVVTAITVESGSVARFSGTGRLSAGVREIPGHVAQFSGAGTLQAIARHATPFSGTGTLSATVTHIP
jgi:hypothetical protein